jgi:RNA polymerase sigma-70 factor (ECF subfamily)
MAKGKNPHKRGRKQFDDAHYKQFDDAHYKPAPKSFVAIYKELLLPVTGFVIKRMGATEAEAEEIVEETFVAAWRGWNSFEHKSSYFTWLCRISLNKISDYYRDQVNKHSRIVVPLIDALTEADKKTLAPEEAMALEDLRKSVNRCLDSMSPEKRKLLQFKYWQNLSYKEIGKILNITERAVEGRIYRAKEEFEKVWNERK